MVDDILNTELTGQEIEAFKAKFSRFSHLPSLNSLLSYLALGYNRWSPGDFEMALLSNNLMRSFSTADCNNRLHVHEYCNLLYNYFPSNSWGSIDSVKNWTNKSGRAYVQYVLENK